MRKQILSALFVFAIIALGFSFVSAQKISKNKNVQQKKLNQPTAKEAVRTLLDTGNVSLAPYRSCKAIVASTKDNTVFDYLSEIISYQSEDKSKNSLGFEVTLKRGKNGEPLWVCYLMFRGEYQTRTDGGDSDNWSMGFRFSMRNSDRKMVRSSLECLAAG
jgi:hypothetical protein